MQIWIDADACPRDVKDVVFRASERLGLPVVLVANRPLALPRSPLVSLLQVKKGPDVADDAIAARAAPEDIVVTADIPLAAILVEKGVTALDPRGDVYDEETVSERLSIRDFMSDLRDAGLQTGGPRAFGPREKQRFANALDRILTARKNAPRPSKA